MRPGTEAEKDAHARKIAEQSDALAERMRAAMRFEIDGRSYMTDPATLAILREQVAIYRANGERDASAITAVMALGLETGAISEEAGQR